MALHLSQVHAWPLSEVLKQRAETPAGDRAGCGRMKGGKVSALAELFHQNPEEEVTIGCEKGCCVTVLQVMIYSPSTDRRLRTAVCSEWFLPQRRSERAVQCWGGQKNC